MYGHHAVTRHYGLSTVPPNRCPDCRGTGYELTEQGIKLSCSPCNGTGVYQSEGITGFHAAILALVFLMLGIAIVVIAVLSR